MFDYRLMFDLQGKNALVVGAGSGIGQASAVGLAAFGAYVYCADVKPDGLDETVRQVHAQGGQGQALSLDIRDATMIGRIWRNASLWTSWRTPSINIRKPLLDLSEDEFERIISLNLKGTFLLMQAVGRGMAERGRGSIILFASIRAVMVEPGQGVYAATKAGITQMARPWPPNWGPKGSGLIRLPPVLSKPLLPPPLKTSRIRYQAYADKSALKRWAQPQEIVGMVVYLASVGQFFRHRFVNVCGWRVGLVLMVVLHRRCDPRTLRYASYSGCGGHNEVSGVTEAPSEHWRTFKERDVEPIIRLENVSFSYGSEAGRTVTALQDINLAVQPGEYLVTGP